MLQAGQLFLVGDDLAPLMVFAAGLTGRNPETLKEMPADHRVVEGRALALTLTKRRRGKANSRSTVHWEIVGLGLVARSPWVLASVPTVLLVRGREIRREECGLAAQFGGDWTAYVGRVPGSLLGRVEPTPAAFRQLMSSSSLRSARPPEPPSSEQGRRGTPGERS
jgi:hypothetical protein